MTGAVDYFDKAYNMWDGKGIYDLATEKNHTYANYKLALVLYAYKILNLSVANYPNITQIEDKLWSMQNQSTGGITSLADLNGNPVGSANAETTSTALLPYNEKLISIMQSRHDVSVVSVVPSTSEAYAGQIVNITWSLKTREILQKLLT